MDKPLRCTIYSADFAPDDPTEIYEMRVTLSFGDRTARFRHGKYLLVEADDDWSPATSPARPADTDED